MRMRCKKNTGLSATKEQHQALAHHDAAVWQTINRLKAQVSCLQAELTILRRRDSAAPAPPLKKAEPAPREHGRVRWFCQRLGYGFIAADSGADIFLHHSAIKPPRSGYTPALAPGTAVIYTLKRSRSWARADEARHVTVQPASDTTGRHGDGQYGPPVAQPAPAVITTRPAVAVSTQRRRARISHRRGGTHRRPTVAVSKPPSTDQRPEPSSPPALPQSSAVAASCMSVTLTKAPSRMRPAYQSTVAKTLVQEEAPASCPPPAEQTYSTTPRPRLQRLRPSPVVKATPRAVERDASPGLAGSTTPLLLYGMCRLLWSSRGHSRRFRGPPRESQTFLVQE